MFDTKDPTCPGFYRAEETALLLLDFHSMFVNKMSGEEGPRCVEVAETFTQWAIAHNIEVIHCLVDVDSSPASTCKSAGRLSATVDVMKQTGEAGEVNLPSHTPGEDRITFLRRLGHVSALKSPGLEDHLATCGIKSLLLMGISTSGSVLKTCLAATDADFVTTVIVDGCADSLQEVHEFVVKHLLGNRGWTTDHRDFMTGYDEAMLSM